MGITATEIKFAVLIAVAILGWFFRYDLQVITAGDRAGVAYMLNRWTGNVFLVTPSQMREIKVGSSQQGTLIDLDAPPRNH
jgi:hypothetical protein